MNPEDDFIAIKQEDAKLAGLIDAFMSDGDGGSQKDRKTHLTMEQALQIARARAFADSFIVEEFDAEAGEVIQVEPPLQIVHLICDYLENTSVSINGRGLKQLEAVLTAQAQRQEQSELDRSVGRLTR